MFPPKTFVTVPEVILTFEVETVPDEFDPPYIFVDVVPFKVIFAVVTLAAFPPPYPFVIVPAVKLTFVVGVAALKPPPYTFVVVPPVIYTNDSVVSPPLLFPP